ncbi:MAG: HAMP domain-containing protein [Phycisphaerales bacterium]|nr:MAG: HAMP domain-containing protein [Phycisphaerales bacterium]
MLRRKLMLMLGSLVGLLLIAAIATVLLMQNVLDDLSHVSTSALSGATQTSRLGSTITRVEAELNEIRLQEEAHLDELIDAVETLNEQVRDLGTFYVMRDEASEHYQHLQELLPVFVRHVGDLATTQDEELTTAHTELALRASVAMRETIATLGHISQEHAQREQRMVTNKVRWVALGMALVFLLVINISIMVLLRAANMVLSPVDRLVEASRRLAREEFDHRVELTQRDEFEELGRAYNSLAEHLQLNEQRKLETLHHVARTLNHELNNAISIIDLQLKLLTRGNDGNHGVAKPLRQINETLGRMSETVSALQRVQRIVLTDYLEGVPMLDLERSLEEEPREGKPATQPDFGTRIQ